MVSQSQPVTVAGTPTARPTSVSAVRPSSQLLPLISVLRASSVRRKLRDSSCLQLLRT